LPAAVTVIEAVVAPVLHRIVVPEDAVAVSVAELCTQVSVWSAPALTVGTVFISVTWSVAVLVHPLAGLVTVKV